MAPVADLGLMVNQLNTSGKMPNQWTKSKNNTKQKAQSKTPIKLEKIINDMNRDLNDAEDLTQKDE